jgi:hypothetical protein
MADLADINLDVIFGRFPNFVVPEKDELKSTKKAKNTIQATPQLSLHTHVVIIISIVLLASYILKLHVL